MDVDGPVSRQRAARLAEERRVEIARQRQNLRLWAMDAAAHGDHDTARYVSDVLGRFEQNVRAGMAPSDAARNAAK